MAIRPELDKLIEEMTECLSVIQNKKVSRTWVINKLIELGLEEFKETFLNIEMDNKKSA